MENIKIIKKVVSKYMTKINYKFVATTNVSNRKIIYIDENDFRKN